MFIPVRATPLVAAATVLAAGLVMPGLGPAPAAPASTRYRVVASLQPDTVLVGHRVTVTGAVRPGAPEKAVKLQVYADGVWHTVAVTALEQRALALRRDLRASACRDLSAASAQAP